MDFVWNLTIQGKKENEEDLNLEGFSVLGSSIIDCVALRKLVYRPKNRRPDKILKNPLINQLESALVYLCVSTRA